MTVITLTGIARAAVVALALGAGAFAGTVPAQAQGFSFSLGFGNGPAICLTDFQLRRSVENRGYTDVRLNVAIDNRINVRATRDGWIYQLLLNACTGRLLDRERLRRS